MESFAEDSVEILSQKRSVLKLMVEHMQECAKPGHKQWLLRVTSFKQMQ